MFATSFRFLTLAECLAPARPLLAGLAATVRGVVMVTGMGVDRLLAWQERARQRSQLCGLDDALLKDIGCSRAEAEAEAAKPFWRA